jgi:hypothetical protein
MRKGNYFKLSEGNLKILQLVPEMMTSKKWRNKLRNLVLEFLFDMKRPYKRGVFPMTDERFLIRKLQGKNK